MPQPGPWMAAGPRGAQNNKHGEWALLPRSAVQFFARLKTPCVQSMHRSSADERLEAIDNFARQPHLWCVSLLPLAHA